MKYPYENYDLQIKTNNILHISVFFQSLQIKLACPSLMKTNTLMHADITLESVSVRSRTITYNITSLCHLLSSVEYKGKTKLSLLTLISVAILIHLS